VRVFLHSPRPLVRSYLFHIAQKSRSNASDDDDFIVPDSDTEVKSVKSSSSRSTASRRSVASSDESSIEDKPKKAKPKPKPSAKRAAGGKKGATAAVAEGTSGGTNAFLTAAEQREQGKKNEKKVAEEAYSFLADVQDVRFQSFSQSCWPTIAFFQKERRRPGDPNYDPRTLHIPAKAWKEFTPFEKQVRLIQKQLTYEFAYINRSFGRSDYIFPLLTWSSEHSLVRSNKTITIP